MGNREIKFRGWHTGMQRMALTEELVEDQMTLLADGRFINVHGGSTSLSEIIPADKFIPLQFTGLKDKYGVEIYEGDILSIPTAFDVPVPVEFNVLGHICAVTDKGQSSLLIGEIDRCEVLGNIYENPELLQPQ